MRQNTVGLIAEGLAVDEVGPAPDYLAQYQGRAAHVEGSPNRYLLEVRPYDDGQGACDGAAVHGDAALPDFEDVDEVVLVAVPLADDIVDSAADNGDGQHPEHQREDVVALYASLGALRLA